MYLVRFIRIDTQPEEVYYYNNLQDAENHYKLFLDDDSGLYRRIELLKVSGIIERLIYSYCFDNSRMYV